MDGMKQVLFLCSANYYRSRFAEHLFNWLAEKSDLPWRAESRGLRTGHYGNIGPISRYAVEGLKLRGIPINGKHRYPLELTLTDLTGSDLVIAVKEAEHRVMLRELFPLWTNLVEYWHVDDLDCGEPEEALLVLDGNVRALVERLVADEEK
jgi:protein-tyrosine phosphatase